MLSVEKMNTLMKVTYFKKIFSLWSNPPKNVPNHYSELPNLKGRKFRRFDIFFEDGAKVKRD